MTEICKMVFEGPDSATGENFFKQLKNEECVCIILESQRGPSVEFCKKIREDFGFRWESTELREEEDIFKTIFRRIVD